MSRAQGQAQGLSGFSVIADDGTPLAENEIGVELAVAESKGPNPHPENSAQYAIFELFRAENKYNQDLLVETIIKVLKMPGGIDFLRCMPVNVVE